MFADTTFDFLRDKVPKNWAEFRDSVTDNFRFIKPGDFRVIAGAGYRIEPARPRARRLGCMGK